MTSFKVCIQGLAALGLAAAAGPAAGHTVAAGAPADGAMPTTTSFAFCCVTANSPGEAVSQG